MPKPFLYAFFGLWLGQAAAAPLIHGEAADFSPNPAIAVSSQFPGQAPETFWAALAQAKELLEAGKLDEAEAAYQDLRRNTSGELGFEPTFQLAQIRLRQGRFRQAISLFLEILNQRPDLPRVRLDLALAYFLDKNYEDAARQFELVKGGDLPPEVLTKVEGFLDAIRRQKNWTVDFSMGLAPDSNINQASGGKEECINLEGLTLCRPLPQKASGVGANLNATVNYFQRLSPDWGLKATLGGYGLAYEQNDNEYNDYSFYAALGPRYLWDSGEASLQPTFRKRWLANREYSREYGLRSDLTRNFGRLILEAGLGYGESRYDEAYIDGLLRGSSWNSRFWPRYVLNDRTFVQAGLDFLRENAEERACANENWRYALGLYRVFPYGISLYAEGSLMETDYKATQWYITQDNRIAEKVRRDKTRRLLTSFSSNAFESLGWTPVLQYTYTNRESNIWSREYEQHRVSLLFNYRI